MENIYWSEIKKCDLLLINGLYKFLPILQLVIEDKGYNKYEGRQHYFPKKWIFYSGQFHSMYEDLHKIHNKYMGYINTHCIGANFSENRIFPHLMMFEGQQE